MYYRKYLSSGQDDGGGAQRERDGPEGRRRAEGGGEESQAKKDASHRLQLHIVSSKYSSVSFFDRKILTSKCRLGCAKAENEKKQTL
jgi:hypothetical protein